MKTEEDETGFEEMFLEAERLRGRIDNNRFVGDHAWQMKKIKMYAEEHGLFHGTIEDGTANTALLNFNAEIAACRLSVSNSEKTGSIFSLSREKKLELIKKAAKIG